VGVWGSRVGGLGWRVWGLSLEKYKISVQFLPTFLFVPLKPVPFLHAPVLFKIIVGFNKQTLPTHIAEFWSHPAPPIRMT